MRENYNDTRHTIAIYDEDSSTIVRHDMNLALALYDEDGNNVCEEFYPLILTNSEPSFTYYWYGEFVTCYKHTYTSHMQSADRETVERILKMAQSAKQYSLYLINN